ncbi:MAG: NAD(+)/NADH kinase, partial [Clostridiales bacterium]|nr:NAD(+)/NADH kinase [Clostridiales bacterium]
MKTIGLYVNSQRDGNYAQTSQVAGFLRSKGIETRLCGDIIALERFNTLPAAAVKETDCLVALGGDGTLLKAAKAAAVCETPVLGLNLGRLGYLTDAPALA